MARIERIGRHLVSIARRAALHGNGAGGPPPVLFCFHRLNKTELPRKTAKNIKKDLAFAILAFFCGQTCGVASRRPPSLRIQLPCIPCIPWFRSSLQSARTVAHVPRHGFMQYRPPTTVPKNVATAKWKCRLPFCEVLFQGRPRTPAQLYVRPVTPAKAINRRHGYGRRP